MGKPATGAGFHNAPAAMRNLVRTKLVVARNLATIATTERAPGHEVDAIADEVDRAVAEDQVHAAGMPGLGGNGGAQRRQPAARSAVRRRDVLIVVLAMHPGRAHENWELVRWIINVCCLTQTPGFVGGGGYSRRGAWTIEDILERANQS